MDERISNRKQNEYKSLSTSQSLHLQSEVRMLEDRLRNLEYLKQTYERSAREKSIELERLSNELSVFKSQMIEKNLQVEEINYQYLAKEKSLLKILEESRDNKRLLEEELNQKIQQVSRLEANLQEQYDGNLKLVDENQRLRKEIKEKEEAYCGHVMELEERLKEITEIQRITEERVDKVLGGSTVRRKKSRVKKEINKPGSEALGKKTKIAMIGSFSEKNSNDFESRLLNSEKKLRHIESLLSTSNNGFGSPLSLKSTAKVRSITHSVKGKNKL